MVPEPPQSQERGLIVTAAALVVIIAGLRAAEPVLVPLMVGLLVALVAIPPIRFLQRWNVPTWAAITVVAAMATLSVLFVSAVVGASAQEFRESLPSYRARLNDLLAALLTALQEMGADISVDELSATIDSGAIMELVGDTAGGVIALLSNVFLVILITIFILLEANGFSAKLRLALGDPQADLSEYSRAADRVYQYVFIKACVSAATGVLISLLMWSAGVDFPLLWGLVAFLFNFVPNIGSIIAALPAILLAVIQNGVGNAVVVTSMYLAVNIAIGNVIEPLVMGERLGLSTLVVFLSLLFWGWLWGPVGMILSVPLTVIVKIICDHSPAFRPVGVLLGPTPAGPAPPSSS
jgi:AI-2 transport protein TqsA